MLRWDRKKDKIGELDYKAYDGHKYTLNLFDGNALLVAEWEGEKHYQLMFFFVDKEHMKNCLGLTKGHDNIFENEPWEELRFNNKVKPETLIAIIKAVLKIFPKCKIKVGDLSENM